MNMQVKLQIGQLVESFVAQSAAVRLLARMDEEMVAQIAFLMETLTTDVTEKFLLFAVRPYVGFKCRRTVEGLLAYMTLMRFLARVNDFVST